MKYKLLKKKKDELIDYAIPDGEYEYWQCPKHRDILYGPGEVVLGIPDGKGGIKQPKCTYCKRDMYCSSLENWKIKYDVTRIYSFPIDGPSHGGAAGV